MWCVVLVILLCAALGEFLSEVIMLWHLYGADAVFRQGLHIVKRKPTTVLSNGVVWSDNLAFIHFLLSIVLWFGSAVLTWYLLRWLFSAWKTFKGSVPN